MKKITSDYLYFISGTLFAITSILNFSSSKISLGLCYICLAITFISLGFNYRKRNNKH